ncbi:MAG: heterocyst frequency control protein PatD [Leptolyngbyaceae cyanobacterium CSU_1_4]|nr:heterocyst frequency control protein PatD [Leptolyngbyaceae cyanobacterium CSU_1_4]
MENYRPHYEDLQQQVSQLQAIAAHRQDVAEFQSIFLKMQQGMGGVNEEKLGVKAQSYQTEINKQLRLLSIDLIFLKSARQSATHDQRWNLMGDRSCSSVATVRCSWHKYF